MFSDSIIYGIGNEFLITAICVVVFTLALFYYAFKRRERSQLWRKLSKIMRPAPTRQEDGDGLATQVFNDTGRLCPICLTDHQQLSLETNCGHVYCGFCLQSLYTYGHYLRLRCPLCRQRISTLSTRFTQAEINASIDSDIGILREELSAMATSYNNSGSIHLIVTYLIESPIVLRGVLAELMTIRFRPHLQIAFIAASVFVLFLPQDIFELTARITELIQDLKKLILIAINIHEPDGILFV